MSKYVGDAIFCQQCEEGIVISARSKNELRTRLEEQGWAPYGTGVTPLAEENAERGEFACPRCTNELVDQRLNRLAKQTIDGLGMECNWMVVRDANSPNDFLRITSGGRTLQIPFEHFKTDREMREHLGKQLSAALRNA